MRSVCGLLVALLCAGCATSFVVHAPELSVKSARDAEILAEIRRVGRPGDWLVTRGYHMSDNLVSAATNTPWSHAAVLDLDHDQVIEAESQGVHTSPLPKFVAGSHRLLVVRPSWSNEKSSGQAVIRARAWVGKGYDFLGLAGLDIPERFYCSELVVAVYRPHIPATERFPRPIAPSQLHHWGRILYDSGNP